MTSRPTSASLSRDDLRLMAERTEKQIRTAVALVIPESESWKVDVDMISGRGSLNRPLVLPASADSRHRYAGLGDRRASR